MRTKPLKIRLYYTEPGELAALLALLAGNGYGVKVKVYQHGEKNTAYITLEPTNPEPLTRT